MILGIGIALNTITGLYVGIFAYSVAMLIQTIWLWYRSNPALAAVYQRDKTFIS